MKKWFIAVLCAVACTVSHAQQAQPPQGSTMTCLADNSTGTMDSCIAKALTSELQLLNCGSGWSLQINLPAWTSTSGTTSGPFVADGTYTGICNGQAVNGLVAVAQFNSSLVCPPSTAGNGVIAGVTQCVCQNENISGVWGSTLPYYFDFSLNVCMPDLTYVSPFAVTPFTN